VARTAADDTKSRIMQLVDEGLISPRFHAIVDLRCGEVIGYEGLTRPAPGSGFERPDLLFDAALATGTQFELESLALEMLLTQANAWAEAPLLFVNTTPAFLADDRAVPFILDIIDSLDRVRPARIVLEVTERSDLSYDNILSERVEQLTGRGFQIAIDDVGAGANGLNRIMRLKPGWLKLDRELVAGIDADPVRENLIRFMIRFARLTGVRLIAEGIETDPELKRLCALGAQFGQGFIFGKPEPAPRSRTSGDTSSEAPLDQKANTPKSTRSSAPLSSSPPERPPAPPQASCSRTPRHAARSSSTTEKPSAGSPATNSSAPPPRRPHAPARPTRSGNPSPYASTLHQASSSSSKQPRPAQTHPTPLPRS